MTTQADQVSTSIRARRMPPLPSPASSSDGPRRSFLPSLDAVPVPLRLRWKRAIGGLPSSSSQPDLSSSTLARAGALRPPATLARPPIGHDRGLVNSEATRGESAFDDGPVSAPTARNGADNDLERPNRASPALPARPTIRHATTAPHRLSRILFSKKSTADSSSLEVMHSPRSPLAPLSSAQPLYASSSPTRTKSNSRPFTPPGRAVVGAPGATPPVGPLATNFTITTSPTSSPTTSITSSHTRQSTEPLTPKSPTASATSPPDSPRILVTPVPTTSRAGPKSRKRIDIPSPPLSLAVDLQQEHWGHIDTPTIELDEGERSLSMGKHKTTIGLGLDLGTNLVPRAAQDDDQSNAIQDSTQKQD